MGVILNNPRYERLAQCLAAGMRQADIARELDYSEAHISVLKDSSEIQTRLNELLEAHSQKVSNTGAIADLNERKQILSRLARTNPEQVEITGNTIVSAVKELNLIERVYNEIPTDKQVIQILVANKDSATMLSSLGADAMARLHSDAPQSNSSPVEAESSVLPLPTPTDEGNITNIVRTGAGELNTRGEAETEGRAGDS